MAQILCNSTEFCERCTCLGLVITSKAASKVKKNNNSSFYVVECGKLYFPQTESDGQLINRRKARTEEA